MPSFEVHCADCKRELGEEFPDVHIWLDEYFSTMGPKHRIVRHHVEGIEEARRIFGDRGAKAAEIHIRADCDGKVPTMEQIKLQSLFTWGKK